MRYLSLLILLLVSQCASNSKYYCIKPEKSTIIRNDYIISNNIDSLYYIIPDIEQIVTSDSIYNANLRRFFFTPYYHELDTFRQYASVGFFIDPEIDIDLLVFCYYNKRICGFIKMNKERANDTVIFRYGELFDFFKLPAGYYIYCFINNKMFAIDRILLP